MAVAIAGLISVLFRVRHGYWMIMVAGAVLQVTHVSTHSGIRAVQRVLGTALGLAVFALVRSANARGAWLIGVLVLLQLAIEVVVARHYALALTFITPTALTIAAAAATNAPRVLVGERLGDTLVGAVVATVVLWASEWTSQRKRSSWRPGHNHDHAAG